MSAPTLHRMDDRGRVTLASAIRKAGAEVALLWTLTVGANNVLTLIPYDPTRAIAPIEGEKTA